MAIARPGMGLIRLSLVAGLAAVGVGSLRGEDEKPEAPLVVPSKKWTVLHRTPANVAGIVPLDEKSPVRVAEGLKLTGVKPGHPLWLSAFTSDAEWGVAKDGLRATAGKNAALRLARAADFDLEGIANVEGLGGWFVLVGWSDGHGYLAYNVTTKESGSPWIVAEVRGNKVLEETHREVARHEWKGPQPFRLAVAEKSMGLIVGKDEVFKDVPVPNYAEGEVIVGTYDTKYGPKKLRIQSLRVKAR